jgi:hypothetical protein
MRIVAAQKGEKVAEITICYCIGRLVYERINTRMSPGVCVLVAVLILTLLRGSDVNEFIEELKATVARKKCGDKTIKFLPAAGGRDDIQIVVRDNEEYVFLRPATLSNA